VIYFHKFGAGFYVKCPSFLSYFNKIRISPIEFGKNIQISYFKKIPPVEAEFFSPVRTDG